MAELSDIEKFQRWLQSQLDDVGSIEDVDERERRQIQLESSIQETINFRSLMSLVEDIAPPFVERESSVRVVSNDEVVKESSGSFCSSCEKPITPELDFCINCGEFL
ncbi:hypothetical protein OAH71_01390 [Euryarchaeota archaeon]|jgi:uncharacterized membrane protein YheB (UPF0754 family)|nr:hypothetical protein [Euryarchaeota archaeon]MDB4602552.1 hypothetical protein [Euryarchaeota archaeon]MDG1542527.1 hypothetical protein [Candidatus Thalassarchaeaceae archaeon]|tara:strand:- start:628 stop:948 length:321 start_codon:yes stop_codon:yes gene_type:complete